MGVSTHILGASKHRGALYIHNTKKSMLCQTKGGIHMPHTFGCPHRFGYPHMFECPMYVWMAPCMFGCPCMLGLFPMFEFPLYAWTNFYMFICPHIFGWCLDATCTYTTQRKHALSDYGGVHMPPYMWMPPVCLDATICLASPLYVWMLPNVWWHLKVWGTSKHIRGVQTYWGI